MTDGLARRWARDAESAETCYRLLEKGFTIEEIEAFRKNTGNSQPIDLELISKVMDDHSIGRSMAESWIRQGVV